MVQSEIHIWQTLLLAMIHQRFTHRKPDLHSFSKTLQNILSGSVMLHESMAVDMVCSGVPVIDLTNTDEAVLKRMNLLVTGCYLKYMGDSSVSEFSFIPQYRM